MPARFIAVFLKFVMNLKLIFQGETMSFLCQFVMLSSSLIGSVVLISHSTVEALIRECDFSKFTEEDVMAFVRCGQFDRLLRLEFGPEVEAFAVNLLFTFVYRAKKANLDGQWEQLFEIGSHFFDSSKVPCGPAALKIITALLVNPAMGTHLPGNLTRIQHIIAVASEDWENPEIRKVGDFLKQVTTPKASIEEV
jgi:hypothetical protein